MSTNRRSNTSAAVFTFDYPPEQYFSGNHKLIVDFKTKQELIFASGIQEIAWVTFSEQFARLTAEQFITDILLKELGASHLVCGFNYRFGAKAKGDPGLLQEYGLKYGFQVSVISPNELGGLPISSTRIRNALESGEVLLAATLLGRYHSYFGKIVSGKQIGRELGFPTANLMVQPGVVLPKPGVYLTWCYLPNGEGYPAMTSVGNNPTISGKNTTIESYLIGFSGDLYGLKVELQFLKRMRDIIRFPDVSQLKTQLQADKAMVLQSLPEYHLQADRIVLELTTE